MIANWTPTSWCDKAIRGAPDYPDDESSYTTWITGIDLEILFPYLAVRFSEYRRAPCRG